MSADLFTLFFGAFIGILGSILGYCLNHFLKLREKSIIREFEMRKEGREFYLGLYAQLANLAELVSGYLKAVRSKKGKVLVIVEGTYKVLTPDNVVSQFNKAYMNSVKFCYDMRMKGYELFLSDDICQTLHEILEQSMHFSKHSTWDLESAQDFINKADSTTHRIEEILGIRRRPWKERLLGRKKKKKIAHPSSKKTKKILKHVPNSLKKN